MFGLDTFLPSIVCQQRFLDYGEEMCGESHQHEFYDLHFIKNCGKIVGKYNFSERLRKTN